MLRKLLLGLGAIAASYVPIAALGFFEPGQWGAKAWLSDLVPHLVHGLATAAVYKAIAPGGRPS